MRYNELLMDNFLSTFHLHSMVTWILYLVQFVPITSNIERIIASAKKRVNRSLRNLEQHKKF